MRYLKGRFGYPVPEFKNEKPVREAPVLNWDIQEETIHIMDEIELRTTRVGRQ